MIIIIYNCKYIIYFNILSLLRLSLYYYISTSYYEIDIKRKSVMLKSKDEWYIIQHLRKDENASNLAVKHNVEISIISDIKTR